MTLLAEQPPAPAHLPAPAAHDHAVQFYETDGFLAESVASYLAEGLRAGEPAVVIAVPEHRALFTALLRDKQIDVDHEIDLGRLVMLDADSSLQRIVIDGAPNRDSFFKTIGGVFAQLARTWPGKKPRAYGEMVDLLWRRGTHDVAIALEQLWNELPQAYEFSLLCAYVMEPFYLKEGIPQICALHSHVLPPEPSDRAADGSVGALALTSLVAEIARRTAIEATLRDSIRRLRRAEEEARSARTDLEEFLTNAVVSIHRVDRTGIIRWANKAELELLGYSPDEYIGHHIAEFHASQPTIRDILARLTRGETLNDYDAALRAKDGTIRHVQISSNVQRRDGEFFTTRCFSRDVTALKQAEADRDAIYRVAELLSSQLELDKVVQTLTDEAKRLCRAEAGVYDPSYRSDAIVRFDDVTEHGVTGLPSLCGHVRSYLGLPVLSRSGEILGGLFFGHSQRGVFTDRDQRLIAAVASQASAALENARLYEAERQARAAAEMAERRTATLLGIASELSRALSADEATRIVVEETCKLIGAEAGCVLLLDATGARTDRIMIHGSANAEAAAQAAALPLDADVPVCEAARTGHSVWITGAAAIAARYPHLQSMRDQVQAQTWGAVPIVFEGKSLGAIGFRCLEECPLSREDEALLTAIGRQCAQAIERARLHDMTQAARAQAEEASRAKDDFLAMLGHELRNPLSPILTAVQLMRIRGETSSAKEQNIIERQVGHLIHLVDDLLDISRITRGKVQLEKKPVKLAAVISKAVEIASPLFDERRHHVDLSMPSGDIWIEADEIRLCQVFSNVLTNAAKYTNAEGRIEISVVCEAREAVVRVKDNGIGIPSELLPRVFDLFVQGGRGSDRRQGGLGIGLALVRNLVTLHGGTVSAASEGAGRGSEIVVRLPLVELSRPAAAGDRGLRQRIAVQPRKILIVDDNDDAANLLGEMFGSMGHEVVVASDGPRALELVKQFRPEVAILDIGLPVMDGYELAVALRERLGSAMRIMAVTGYGQEKDRARAEAAGFDAHFVKPVTLAKLIAAIEVPGSGTR